MAEHSPSAIKLSIILPVYNEGGSIREVIARIERSVTVPHEVLVVYDFEEDNTLPILRPLLARSSRIRLVKNRSRGVISAIKTGAAESTGEAIVMTTGDGSEDPLTMNAMYQKIEEGFDLVCGSRYMPGGQKIGGPRMKTGLSRWSGISLHWLTGVPTHDISNGFKMYRKALWEAIPIESVGGYEFGLEITMKAYYQGYRITEVPTTWRDRTAGASKFKLLRWLPGYLYWYMKALGWRLRGVSAVNRVSIDSSQAAKQHESHT